LGHPVVGHTSIALLQSTGRQLVLTRWTSCN